MAGRYKTQGVSSFSWRREAEMSAARQRLSDETEAPPARPIGRQSVWRVLGYTIVLAALAAAIFCAIAFKLRWPASQGSIVGLLSDPPTHVCIGSPRRVPQSTRSSAVHRYDLGSLGVESGLSRSATTSQFAGTHEGNDYPGECESEPLNCSKGQGTPEGEGRQIPRYGEKWASPLS